MFLYLNIFENYPSQIFWNKYFDEILKFVTFSGNGPLQFLLVWKAEVPPEIFNRDNRVGGPLEILGWPNKTKSQTGISEIYEVVVIHVNFHVRLVGHNHFVCLYLEGVGGAPTWSPCWYYIMGNFVSGNPQPSQWCQTLHKEIFRMTKWSIYKNVLGL